MEYNSEIKEVKEYKLARSLLYNLVLSIFITLVLAVIAVYAFGLRLDIVLSDSMAPTFYKDDIVIVKAFDDYKVGDIIEYQRNSGKSVTHRIVDKEGSGKNAIFYTLGDNSSSNDPEEVLYAHVNGKVIDVIEDGNNIYQFIKTNYFLFIDIVLGVWVLTSTFSSEQEMRKHHIAKD